jgi:hypothetical protein
MPAKDKEARRNAARRWRAKKLHEDKEVFRNYNRGWRASNPSYFAEYRRKQRARSRWRPADVWQTDRRSGGDIVGYAAFQSQNKVYANERERTAAARQRARERQRQRDDDTFYASVGDWSPDDELPDPDE